MEKLQLVQTSESLDLTLVSTFICMRLLELTELNEKDDKDLDLFGLNNLDTNLKSLSFQTHPLTS